MRRMAMKMSNGELYDDIGYDKGYIWIRSNYSLFQMFFWNSHIKSQKKYLNQDFEGIHCWDMAAGALIVSEAGGVVRLVLISSFCLHFLILSPFPHFVFISSFCPHFLILSCTSCTRVCMCACNPHHRFWIPLAVTLTWWAVTFLSAGNYRSSHCYLKLLRNPPWEQIK